MSEEKKKLNKEAYKETVNSLNFHAVNNATQETVQGMQEMTKETKENDEVTL